jgi:penicillin-binding protein 2
MCFAPAENPEVALVVIVENAGHGSSEAAPVAGRWLRSYFAVDDSLTGYPASVTVKRRPGG